MKATTRSRIAAIAALPIALALLTGCATGAQQSASPSASPTPAAITSFDDWQVAYAACLRDQGIDIADPGQGGSSGFSVDDSDLESFAAAGQTCRGMLGAPPARDGETPRTESERQEQQLRAAACLRERGFDVDDPKPGQATSLPAGIPDDVAAACLTSGGATAPDSGE